ncbi:MAG: FecR domain-containing protein [Flavitalea sp.]
MNKRTENLFRRYLDDTCTREEFDELFDYIKQDNNELTEEMVEKFYAKQSHPVPGHRRFVIPAIAASVLVMVCALTWYIAGRTTQLNNAIAADLSKIKSTRKKQSGYIILPDSTQVWLNADSKLEYPETFDASVRTVTLKGEAFFDVKHADKVPFVIKTGKVSTVVLGTAFNIKAYPEQEKITVSVKRGKVKVNYSERQVALLEMGQQVSIAADLKDIRKKIVKADETAAWQDGQMIFDDETIGDIIVYLAKTYDVNIIVDNPALRSVKITTAFKKEIGITKVLEILTKLTDSEMNYNDGTYVIK